MKLSIKNILVAASLSLSVCAAAQNTRTGYFLDDYTYRYQMNPAYANTRGFFAFPALGNVNVGVNGTLGLSDILYVKNGKTVTFLNPQVPASEVLGNIKDMNRLGLDLNLPIFAFGFKAFHGYNTVTISTHASMGVKVPGAAFHLLKEGLANKSYEIANLKAFGTAYAEVALGHSHQITDDIRIGATLKILAGAGNAYVDMKHANLDLGYDEWQITSEGEATVNLKGFEYKTDINDRTGHKYVSGADYDSDDAGLGGMGFALDLGAVYKPSFLPDFEFSLAFQDLGFINWKNSMLASTQGVKKFTTAVYTFNVDDDADNSFKKVFDKVKDALSALYELDNLGDQGSQTRTLGATMNVGVLYSFPFYNKLKFGLLNTTRMQGEFSWTDFRLSANIMPCKVFDASISANAGTFGVGFGWLMNLHCPGFNLFFGMDRIPSKLAKQGAPLDSNASFNFGLDFLF